MAYTPCQFDRKSYLDHAQLFEAVKIDDAENELCEFNNDAEGLAFELAYMRYRVAKLEHFIKNGVELGYIAVPDSSGATCDTINEFLAST